MYVIDLVICLLKNIKANFTFCILCLFVKNVLNVNDYYKIVFQRILFLNKPCSSKYTAAGLLGWNKRNWTLQTSFLSSVLISEQCGRSGVRTPAERTGPKLEEVC